MMTYEEFNKELNKEQEAYEDAKVQLQEQKDEFYKQHSSFMDIIKDLEEKLERREPNPDNSKRLDAILETLERL